MSIELKELLAYNAGYKDGKRDAADAIEALQAENTDIREELFVSQREYDNFVAVASMENAMLAKQIPKRGEMTNADKIRSMTDEELAEWVTSEGRYFGEEYEGYMSLLDWLQEEVQDGQDNASCS